MLPSKTLVVWLFTLLVAYSSSAPSINNALEKSWVKSFHIANKNISFSNLSYNDTHLAYGMCSDSDSEKQCTVTLNHLYSNEKSLSCDVAIKAPNKDTKIDKTVIVAILNNDRALVVSKVGQKFKLINVNFHGCDTNEAELVTNENLHVQAVNVVAYENSYDVFFANSKLCQNRSCRKTFDNDGKVVKDAVVWGGEFDDKTITDLGIMNTIAHHSPAKGFVVRNIINGDEPLVHVVNNEGKKLLTVKAVKDESDIAVSTIGNYIGTCLSSWIEVPSPLNVLEKLECKQFDFDGKLLKTELYVNTSSLVGARKRINRFDRLNLPEGFVLFTIQCPTNHYGGCSGDAVSYFVYRLDGNGKTIKAIEINDFNCGDSEQVDEPRVFENNAGQKCVSFNCYDYEPTQKFSISARCFTDDEL